MHEWVPFLRRRIFHFSGSRCSTVGWRWPSAAPRTCSTPTSRYGQKVWKWWAFLNLPFLKIFQANSEILNSPRELLFCGSRSGSTNGSWQRPRPRASPSPPSSLTWPSTSTRSPWSGRRPSKRPRDELQGWAVDFVIHVDAESWQIDLSYTINRPS